MARTGYIKWFRKGMENFLYKEIPFDQWHAFEDLIFKANSSANLIPFNEKSLKIKRGQLLTSYVELSKQWGWHREKVRRFIKKLAVDQMLVSENVGEGLRNGVLLTIVNYNTYQPKCDKTVSTDVSKSRHNKYNYINISVNAGEKEITLWNKHEWQSQISVLEIYLKRVNQLEKGDPSFCALLLRDHGFLLPCGKISQTADTEKVFKNQTHAKAYLISIIKKTCLDNSVIIMNYNKTLEEEDEELQYPDVGEIMRKQRN